MRTAYTRILTSTLRYRPVVLVLWAIVAALTIPFYMLSQRELAPEEDQGVVFSIIQASPNSTLDQTRRFTQQVLDVYKSIPEADSIFQLTSATNGFGGMVTIRLKGGLAESRRFLERCRVFALAESLGGVESLIEHPAIMTHASLPAEVRAQLGISDNLIRLSVGVEDAGDLIEDLRTALA